MSDDPYPSIKPTEGEAKLTSNGNPWEVCVETLKKDDDKMCDLLKDEIDNLLIFAALFSAIVAAFAIDSYKWLNPSSDNPSLVADNIAVQVNVLWFLSLAASLSVASIAILCMQWIRQYRLWEGKPTKEAVALRRQRFRGFANWRVPDIVSILPVILHLALILFGVGLTRVLWPLHPGVALGFTIVNVVSIVFVFWTMLAPIVQWWNMHSKKWVASSQCPYQCPQAWIFYIVSWGMAALYRLVLGHEQSRNGDPVNWQSFDAGWKKLRVEQRPTDQDDTYEGRLLADELISLDQSDGHNLKGIQARAIALQDLPINNAIAVVRSLYRSLKLQEKFDDKFKEQNPDKHLKTKSLAAWYLWAHARVHPSLDQAYMQARIDFMSGLPGKKTFLPAFPRGETFDIASLADDPQTIARFFRCLTVIIKNDSRFHKLTNDSLGDVWLLIGDLLEYSIRNPYDIDSQTLALLLSQLQDWLSPDKAKAASPTSVQHDVQDTPPLRDHPSQDGFKGLKSVVRHVLEGLRFLLTFHVEQEDLTLLLKNRNSFRLIFDFVNKVDTEVNALEIPDSFWEGDPVAGKAPSSSSEKSPQTETMHGQWADLLGVLGQIATDLKVNTRPRDSVLDSNPSSPQSPPPIGEHSKQ